MAHYQIIRQHALVWSWGFCLFLRQNTRAREDLSREGSWGIFLVFSVHDAYSFGFSVYGADARTRRFSLPPDAQDPLRAVGAAAVRMGAEGAGNAGVNATFVAPEKRGTPTRTRGKYFSSPMRKIREGDSYG